MVCCVDTAFIQVLTIRGIEKYGKVSKKKKAIKEKLKSIFTGEKPEAEQEEEKDRAEAQRIHNQEEGEGRQAHEREVEQEDEKVRRRRESEDKPLPGEGKRIEEMTEEERLERGVALVQRAFEKGLSLKASGEGDQSGQDRPNKSR
jgi:acid phosphatase class B